MKKFLFLFISLAACTALYSQNSQKLLDASLCEDATEQELQQFAFEGTLVQKEEVAPFTGEMLSTLYMVLANDDSEAFDFYFGFAEKNDSINKVVNGLLYFKLGVLEENELKNSARMTAGTEEKILRALEKGDSLHLEMLQNVILGSGASEYTILPCVLDAY